MTLRLICSVSSPDDGTGRRWELAELSPPGMFSEAAYQGMGFGLGFAVITDAARYGVASSLGEFSWGGMASTVFWVDPAEALAVVFLTQFTPSGTFNFRGQLRSIVATRQTRV